MKYILGYILIFLSLELTLSANSKETYGTIRIPSIEKCNSFQKGDTNWYYNNCDQLGSLKSGVKINKKEKVEFTDCSKKKGTVYKQVGMDELGASFFLRSSKINDLRGDGIVYYKFRNPWVDNSRYYLHKSNEYYRLDKNYNVISQGTFKCTGNKNVFELKEDNQKFLWKVSVPNQIVDIKSKLYDYKGYRRYQFATVTNEDENLIYKAVNDHKNNNNNNNNNYVKADSNQDDNLKSAIKINKKDKVPYTSFKSDWAFAQFYPFKINDLRGDGIVYYKLLNKTGKKYYYRLNKDFKIISEGNFEYNIDTRVFKLIEDKKKFFWKISAPAQVIDIKSKFYDFKGYRRFQIEELRLENESNLKSAIENYEKSKYVEVKSGKSDKSSFGYEVAKKYDESDENLQRLWKLVLADKDIKKKYLKYSKKEAKFKGKPIKAMALAVFIDYKKELSILTENKDAKKLSSPIAWGWEYSYKDPAKIKGFKENKTVVGGFEAIRNCYISVRKKKLNLRDGECILVDLRRITTESQYPVIWYNYLIASKNNRILLAKESEKSKEQIANEKKEEEKKKKTLLLAQKKAEEERKKQEKILAKRKKEEEKRKKELLLAQKKEDEKKKQELLLAQKKAEEEIKKQELLLAQKKAEEEKKKQELLLAEEKAKEEKKKQELIAKLKEQELKKISELELAKKEAEKEFEKKKKELNIDQDSPEIIVAEAITVNSQAYKLKGKVKDKSDFFLEVDGQPIKVNKEGEFLFEGFIIDTAAGEELTIVAVDRWNNASEKSVKINVKLEEMKVAKGYEKLLPNKINVKKDKNKIAIIIGVEKYENLTNLDAAFANRDANAFREYAVRALGVDPSNINLLVDKDASRPKILKALKLWLPKIGGENMDIYLFFAGHGLASDDGKNLYILPQDGDASLLEDTAITRNEIIKILQKTNPKTVTMFFDTCYSGQTRNEETLIASLRPVRIVADEQAIPDNFTIFTASANDQTSGSIEEAKHGMFSYFLMKGMEGEADENEDNKISNGELISYIQNNVSKVAFSQNREQDPGMSGDKDKILFSYK